MGPRKRTDGKGQGRGKRTGPRKLANNVGEAILEAQALELEARRRKQADMMRRIGKGGRA